MRIGILGHPKRSATRTVGERIAQSLSERGNDTWHYPTWTPEQVRPELTGSDLVIAIGGDGAMLRSARLCAEFDVPVLGVNMGRLGFLTEVASPDDWPQVIDPLLRGDYWIERRMMIDSVVMRDGEARVRGNALNDVVISGRSAGQMITINLYIDRHWATTYNSDALIIATPTGSTAYALAAGGPILPPDLLNILIVPTAPHLSMERPIVLSEGSQVAVRVSEDTRHQAIVTCDGSQLAELTKDDILYIQGSDYVGRFVRLRDRNYFYRSLLDRLEPRVNHSMVHERRMIDDFQGDDPS